MRTLRICTTALLATLTLLAATAQPEAKKSARSVVTIKLYADDGTLAGDVTGFYVGENGEAVSVYTPFVGAARAVAVDAEGEAHDVDRILGADALYDAVKVHIDVRRSTPLVIGGAADGDPVWIAPYSTDKAPATVPGTVTRTETFEGQYSFYTMTFAAGRTTSRDDITSSAGAPVLNRRGECIGVLLTAATAKDTLSYAVSARFASSLTIRGLSVNDDDLNKIKIKKDLPDDIDQAVLSLYVAAAADNTATYREMVNDFTAKFPASAEGYVRMAQIAADDNDIAAADRYMQQALRVSDKKDDTHYCYAKMIFGMHDSPGAAAAGWTADKAASEADEAYRLNPLPIYKQLKGQMLFLSKDYAGADRVYNELILAGDANAEIFIGAAQCKELLGDTAAVLALTDSAVNTFSRPYLRAAAPYLLARAQARINTGKYRDAVSDLNDYESLMAAHVNDNFYYIRAKAETDGHMYAQALKDYERAINKAPDVYVYYAEKAALEVRVGLYDQAAHTASECISLNDSESDGYLFLGLAQCLAGNKTDGHANLLKAKERGNAQADELIHTYAQ